ncbi:unnamed protein product [Nezara viridula]|uniref:FHA domain-containing protein n=1 Tax=Nezara viridula TaxID=85310 RepID=A0A9P0HA46_NEZVI|nr:unnamed protein product [Nezara viridula]
MEQQRVWLLQRIFNVDTNPIVIKEGLYKIGRSPESNIFCRSEWVSRCHCDVTVKGGNVYIRDLGSLNGTYIEQTEILKERDLQLKDGDIISLGKPFLGDIAETNHYVYRLVECNGPQGPKKRKRNSLSPQNEEISKGNCSPKRIRESIEKQKKDSLTIQQDLPPNQEVLLEEAITCNQKRKVLPLHTAAIGFNQVSSSDKGMECIDLTDDGSQNMFPDKSSSCGPLADKESTSPDSSECKNPILPGSNACSLNKNAKIIQAVMKLLENNDSDKVLKNIEILSGGIEKPEENVSHNINLDNKSITANISSNLNNEQIISSNVGSIEILTSNESSSCHSQEFTNYCLKQNKVKIEADAEVSLVQPIHENRENVSYLENKEIFHDNRYKTEYEEESCFYEPDLAQLPSNLNYCSDIISSNVGSSHKSVLSNAKNATEKIQDENEELNYKPQIKKTRSDSFASEMEKLDSLLKGLNENKEINVLSYHNEKRLVDPISIESDMKHFVVQNEICKNISVSNKDNIPKADNIKVFHKSIDTTCRGTELPSRKNSLDMSLLQNKSNALINMKQLTCPEQNKTEVKMDSLSRTKSGKDQLENIKMDSPLSSKLEKDKSDVKVDSISSSKPEKDKSDVQMDALSKINTEKNQLQNIKMDSPLSSKLEKDKSEIKMDSLSSSKPEKDESDIKMDSLSSNKPEKEKTDVKMDSLSSNKPENDKSGVKMDSLSSNKPEKDKSDVKMNSLSSNKPEKDKTDVKMDSPSRNNHFESLPFVTENDIHINIKQELSFEQNDVDEQMVFSQDVDGVVVIDESEDELEYSQLFMELDEVTKEVSNEKTNICKEEEFMYEMNDDNEEIDLFQSHFSQCSQEQELIKTETPIKKINKSQSHSSNDDVSSKDQADVKKSPRSKGKDKRIRDVSVKLKRLDLELLTKTKEISEEEVSESNLKTIKSDYPDQTSAADGLKNNNKIINSDTLEKVKCNEKNNTNFDSFDLPNKCKSNEMIKSDKNITCSVQLEKVEPSTEHLPNKTEQFSKKSEADSKSKGKKIGLKKSSIEKDIVNASYSKKLDLEKSVNTISNITTETNENCPPSNLIKKDSNKSEINKQLQLDKSVDGLVSLPPADSISGARLVKSTLLSKPPTARKKPGRPKKAEPSVTKESLNKKKQKQIIEDRKAKLKSLALGANSKMVENGEKGSAHTEVTLRPEQDLKSTEDKLLDNKSVTRSGSPDKKDGNLTKPLGVAKITERNRGSILLEGLMEDPCRKSSRTKKKIEKANSTLSSTESVSKRSASTSYDKLKEPASSKAGPVAPLPNVTSGGLKSCLKLLGQPRTSIKKVQFNLKMDIKLFECEGSMKSVNAMGLKDKAPSTPIPKPVVTSPMPAITTLEETYFDIVHWNASWINEIKVIAGEPPVHTEKYNAKDAYVSYKDYKRWLYPLMMYELWANMCKTMDDEDANKTGRAFDGIVLESQQYGIHSVNGKNLLLLKCFFPLYGKQHNMVEAMDILLIKALSACEGKRIFFVMFGLVYSAVKFNSYRDTSDPVARHYLTTLNRKPDVCAYFDIIIYKSQKKQLTTGFQLRIRPTYNMITELREFESLIKLASSPLSHIIIDPVTHNSTYLQKEMDNKVVTEYPLNDEQRKAVLCTTQSVFANKPNISLIHGPPGTGKTQVIVSIVQQLLYRFKLKNNYKRKKILICSHSNTAIDEICLRLLDIRQQLPREKRFKLTRFGRKEKMHPRVSEIQTGTLARKEVEKRNLNEEFTLELSLQKATERMVANALENPESPKVESYKRKYEQVQKRIACLEAVVNNKDSSSDTRQKEIERMVFDEEMKVIYHSDIIATTLGSCTQRRITKAFSEMSRAGDEKREVGVCIIDEATQATEADSLLPLVYDVKNFILVGDPQQLPPFVASQTAKKFGLCQSLFARLYKVWTGVPSSPVYMLTAQHRMHPEIAKFPSKAFYNGQLTTPSFLAIKRPFKPYAIVTHTLVQDSNETNLSEARLIVEMAGKLLSEPGMKGLSIGLIVPYQKQRSVIQDLFEDKKVLRQLSVNTIDSYQGQERDVILLSIVRTSGIGFLNDHQRLNVALTRARKALYIVGNFTSLQTTDIWKDLLTDAKERNLQFDAGRAEKIDDIFGFLFERNNKKSRTSNS